MSQGDGLDDYISAILLAVREKAKEDGLDPDRLPGWVQAAHVETAEVNDTLLYLVEEADGDEDDHQHRPEVEADTELLFDVKNVNSANYYLDSVETEYLEGENEPYGEVGSHEDPSTIHLTGSRECIVNLYDGGYHQPILFAGIQYKLEGFGDPIPEKYVPLLMYVHGRETENPHPHMQRMFNSVYYHTIERLLIDED